jgi:hypothetical protein
VDPLRAGGLGEAPALWLRCRPSPVPVPCCLWDPPGPPEPLPLRLAFGLVSLGPALLSEPASELGYSGTWKCCCSQTVAKPGKSAAVAGLSASLRSRRGEKTPKKTRNAFWVSGPSANSPIASPMADANLLVITHVSNSEGGGCCGRGVRPAPAAAALRGCPAAATRPAASPTPPARQELEWGPLPAPATAIPTPEPHAEAPPPAHAAPCCWERPGASPGLNAMDPPCPAVATAAAAGTPVLAAAPAAGGGGGKPPGGGPDSKPAVGATKLFLFVTRDLGDPDPQTRKGKEVKGTIRLGTFKNQTGERPACSHTTCHSRTIHEDVLYMDTWQAHAAT